MSDTRQARPAGRESAFPGGQSAADGSQRLFVAVPLPEDLLPLVQRAQAGMLPVSGMRLLKPEQLHVTLAFIGEADQAKAAAAREVVAGVPVDFGGEGMLSEVLLLPSSTRARAVTLAVRDDAGAFARLFEHVMSGLEQRSVMRREKRPFRPHVTVGRLRAPVPVVLKSECEEAPYRLESVCLYKSELRREGAVYSVLERRRLEGRSE